MTTLRSIIAIMCFGCWMNTTALGATGPNVMPGLQAQWVAPEMTLNGVPMSVRTFSGPMGSQAVLDYYQTRWSRQGVAQITKHKTWQVLSTQTKDRFITVRVRNTDFGCEGFLVSSNLPKAGDGPKTKLPLPQEVRLVSQQRYQDAGRAGETLTLVSSQQPAALAQAFAQVWEESGWQHRQSGPATTVNQGHRASYESKKGLLQLFIHRDVQRYQGQTLILIQHQGPSL